MNITIKVIPGARKNEWNEEAGIIKIRLKAPAVDGKANDALVEFLAEHYQVRRSCIQIIKGLKSRNKIVNISAL